MLSRKVLGDFSILSSMAGKIRRHLLKGRGGVVIKKGGKENETAESGGGVCQGSRFVLRFTSRQHGSGKYYNPGDKLEKKRRDAYFVSAAETNNKKRGNPDSGKQNAKQRPWGREGGGFSKRARVRHGQSEVGGLKQVRVRGEKLFSLLIGEKRDDVIEWEKKQFRVREYQA